MEAIESDDLTIQILDIAGSPGFFSISVSPATAGHDPDYEDMCDHQGVPLIFASRKSAGAFLAANAEAIVAAREAAEEAECDALAEHIAGTPVSRALPPLP